MDGGMEGGSGGAMKTEGYRGDCWGTEGGMKDGWMQ